MRAGDSGHGYRRDVDGLRAVAVLSVIIYHTHGAWLPGGFIGVDIFFVISGFLISRNIMDELAAGRFTLLEFYRRRVKRIAPAMLVVVGVTLLASQWLLLPGDAEGVAESAAWSIASLANVYFWKNVDTSYFAPSSEQLPLLHLWSLGVEEQFYLLWPLVLACLFRTRFLLVTIVVGAAASIGYAQVEFWRDPMFAFYMLPTRAGELFIGAIVAQIIARKHEPILRRSLTLTLSAGGACLIVASLALLNDSVVFPGLLAVPPAVGAALLLATGMQGGPCARALSSAPMVWVGRVSYSAYLWHWPLLAFYRYGHAEIGMAAGLSIFTATFVLAALSYRFVEQPARSSDAGWPRVLTNQYLLPGALVVVFALTAMKLDGYTLHGLGSYRARLDSLRQERTPAYANDYVCQRQLLTLADARDPRCVVGADRDVPPTALLWGDSNAGHYVGMLGVFARQSGYRMRNVAIGSCPPLDSDPAPFVAAVRRSDCRVSLDLVRQLLSDYPVVIMAASYTTYESPPELVASLLGTAARLAAAGKRVVLLAKVPVINGYDPLCREKAIAYPFLRCSVATAVASEGDVVRANERLRQFAADTPNVEFFDAVEYICPAGVCASTNGQGEIVYFDESHLTISASWSLGERIVADSGVPEAFRLDPVSERDGSLR